MQNKILKNKIFWGLLFICFIGIFLRAYHFSDNIFFETDQARDYQNINEVLTEGLGEFPLLGPKAQKTFFRLGSLFYVPALMSSWIFGLSPFSIALPDLIFSILTIPLFYFFLREFFVQYISLGITAIFATALFAVEYAHFAWNPNSAPFFVLFTFYALLRYSRVDTGANKNLWVILLAIATSVAMQLHTITFIAMPLILVLYFIFAKVSISLKHFAVFVAMSSCMFSFMIFSDVLTKGENAREFLKAVLERDNSSQNTTVSKQTFMNMYNFTQFYTLILSSNDYINKPIRIESSRNLPELISKNFGNSVLRNNILKTSLVFIFLVISFIFFLKLYINKRKSNYFKNSIQKHNFILLVLIWQIIFFILFYPLALKVDSRYFLVVLFLPFIILGFLFQLISIYFKRYGKMIIVIIATVLIVSNFYHSFRWLRLIDSYSEANFDRDEIILESYFLVTEKQWRNIVDRINIIFNAREFSNVYIQAHPHHTKSLLYLSRIDKELPISEIFVEKLDSSGLYFVLRETEKMASKGKMPKEFEKYFDIVDEMNFGTVTLVQLELKDRKDFPIREKVNIEYKRSNNRCYMTNLNIEERVKCTLGDIDYIFKSEYWNSKN